MNNNNSSTNNENNDDELTGNDYSRYIYYLNEYNDPFVQELLASPTTPLDVDTTLRLIDLIITPENMISNRISNISKTGDGISFSISSLQSYPLLQTLNVPEDVLINALNKSKYTYNEETQLINIKFERKTVVLLNAPEDITDEGIKQFFGDLSSEIIETRRDIENSWFITFKTEDNAIDAVIKTRGKKLNDTKVNVRIKSESVLKNISFQEQPSFITENRYGTTDQWNYDGYQYYNYQGEYYQYDFKPPFRQNQGARFRGGKGRKYGSRHDSKDVTNIPLQIMGNGQVVYGKKPYNKGQGGPSRKGYSSKRNERRGGHQAPPLGVSHFPPLGSSPRNSNVKRISRDEIVSLHDKSLDVSGEINESPVVSKEINNDLASQTKVEGNLKNDILDAKWWDNNQKRSKSTQRRRHKSNASENKPQLLQDPSVSTRSSSVGKKRRDSTVKKQEVSPVNKEEGQSEVTSTENSEVSDEIVQEKGLKPKWADIARSKNQ